MESDPGRDDVDSAVRSATTIPDLMRTAARLAAVELSGDGCAISRILGDVLVELAEFAGTRKTLYLGHGYLISDYPLTREVIERREPRTVYALDADVVWGLAEIYREGIHRFVNTDAEEASRIFGLVGDRVAELEAER